MRWVLLWVVLVLAAAGVLALIGRSLWRKAKALTAEMSQASERMSAVAASLADLQDQAAGRGPGIDEGWGRPEPPASRRHHRRRA
jgi:hypothetical protein